MRRGRIRTRNCPRSLPGRELSIAEVDKIRIGSPGFGQSPRRVEVVLVIGVGIRGEGLIPERVPVVDLVAPVIDCL